SPEPRIVGMRLTSMWRDRSARQQSLLDGLDLQREIFRVDPTLCQAAGDEPQAGLRGARIHVPQFLSVAETPDRTDARGNLVAEQPPYQILPGPVSGRQHDQVG